MFGAVDQVDRPVPKLKDDLKIDDLEIKFVGQVHSEEFVVGNIKGSLEDDMNDIY